MGLFSKKNKNAPTAMQKATQSVMLSIQSDSRGKVKLCLLYTSPSPRDCS